MINKIFFDITKLCNANCKYCFTNSNNLVDKRELSDKEILDAFNKINKNKINKISIGGGEPFLKNIVEIINNNKEMKISITTNGTILNDKILKCLIENKNVSLTVSLDSLIKENSNKIRKGIDLERVLNNLKILSTNDDISTRLSIRTTVSKHNIDDIFQIINFCEQNNIRKLKINSTNNFGRAKLNNDIIISFEKFMKLLDDIILYCKENNVSCNVELPIDKYLTNKQECLCGETSLYIDYKGDIYPCAFTEEKLLLGNIKDDSLEKILKTKFDHNNNFCINCPINRYKEYDKKTTR